MATATAQSRGRLTVGYIKTFSPTSRWGFIICDEVDRDVFFHMKNFTDDPPSAHINCANGDQWDVEFKLDMEDAKKPKAFGIRVLSGRGGTATASIAGGGGGSSGHVDARRPHPQVRGGAGAAHGPGSDTDGRGLARRQGVGRAQGVGRG
mmetsp:Transcript_23624/g.62292  ORF Transcript_23624/g.62292 Transcript_23624/m.62292 type:complete len:150 (-) Transcript_23624:1521-1970(-)